MKPSILTALACIFLAATAQSQTKRKYVTILYSTWSDYWLTGAGQLKGNGQPWLQPEAPPWGAAGIYHWWGRPAYSSGNLLNYRYMVNNDPNNPNDPLIDNHAQLLHNAGIDFISIDLSNGTQQRIVDGARAVAKRYTERKAAGSASPRIAFFVNNPATATVVKDTFYSGAYGDVFFNYLGKPLILVKDPDSSSVFNTFTVRKIWGLLEGEAANQWSFKEKTPINATPAPSYKVGGWPEERSVCAATQASYMTTSAGRQGRQGGAYFDWHWSLVRKNSPTFVFITAWNEWGSQNLGNTTTPVFTDCYLTEYNADLEPMTGGHGSSYYNTLQTRIGQYKRNVPNIAVRNSSSGTWNFKYYDTDGAHLGANFTATFNWAAGANYQSFTGDFNGDGYNDIGLRDTSTGNWYFARRNTGSFSFTNDNNLAWGTGGTNYQAFTGDFNNDGLEDIGMRDSTDGRWLIRRATSPYSFAGSVVVNWLAGTDYEPLTADFNGDGRVDLGLRQISNGQIRYATQNATPLTFTVSGSVFNWAAGSDFLSFAGDFDNDGKGDLGLRRSSDGLLFLANGNGSLTSFFNDDNIPYTSGSSLRAHAFQGR